MPLNQLRYGRPVECTHWQTPEAKLSIGGKAGVSLKLGEREYAGLGNVTGIQDAHEDIVLPGAFLETLQERKGRIPSLWSHSVLHPIGTHRELVELMPGQEFDGKTGLWFVAVADRHQTADMVLEGMRSKSIQGSSIGFFIKQWSINEEGNEQSKGWPIRLIHKLDLWENSPVVFGANEQAGIYAVAKSFGDDPAPSLRDAFLKALEFDSQSMGGLTTSEVKSIISESGMIKTYSFGSGKATDNQPTQPPDQHSATESKMSEDERQKLRADIKRAMAQILNHHAGCSRH